MLDISRVGPVLVVGASGKTGSRVLRELRKRGVGTRAVSRTTPIPFDWGDAATWREALEGMSAAYVTYSPDLAVPQAVPDLGHFATLAKAAGLERVVLLSGRNEPGAQAAEGELRSVMPQAIVLRSSWFNQNFSEGHFVPYVANGLLELPVEDVREPFIDADDLAEAAANCLLHSGLEGEAYDLTGPELLSFREAAETIRSVSGQSLEFRSISLAAFESGLKSVGLDEETVALMRMLFTEVLDGRNESITDDLMKLLGRESGSFRDFVAREVRLGTWPSLPAHVR